MRTNQRYKDQAKNAFAKTNLFYASGPFLGIQDPTVFGFKLFFHFNNMDSPLLFGINGDIQKCPTNTAAGFLKSIGDQQRLFYLEKFLYLLSGVNSQTPWYFQNLTGLKEAWAWDINKPFIGADKKITIDCLESMDLRVTAMMDLYRKACYDWKHRREVVPKNLRQFKVSVYVYEARVFNNPNTIAQVPTTEQPAYGYGRINQPEAMKTNAALLSRLLGTDETRNDPSTANVNIVEGQQMSTTRNLFHFDYCEFMMNSATHLDAVNNADPQEVKQKIEISYQDFEEENMYNFWTASDPVTDAYVRTLDRIALDDPQLQEPGVPLSSVDRPSAAGPDLTPLGRINDMIADAEEKVNQIKNLDGKKLLDQGKAFGEDLANAAANAAISEVQQGANALIQGLFLGNIYGFSPSSFTSGVAAQQLTGNILDAGASLVNGTGIIDGIQKIFDPIVDTGENTISGVQQVFDPTAGDNGANSTPDGADLGNMGFRTDTPGSEPNNWSGAEKDTDAF